MGYSNVSKLCCTSSLYLLLVRNVCLLMNNRNCYRHHLYCHIDHILKGLVEVVRNLLDLHLLSQEILLHLPGCRHANVEDDLWIWSVRLKVHPHTPIGCRKVVLLRKLVGKLLHFFVFFFNFNSFLVFCSSVKQFPILSYIFSISHFSTSLKGH